MGKFSRRAALIALALALCLAPPAVAQTTLTMSSWVSPQHHLTSVVLQGWASEVEKATNGRVKFTMLRKEHYDTAARYFGTDDFDRVFVVHALDLQSRQELCPALAQKRIHWLTVKEVVQDLYVWYTQHGRPATLRHSLMGDMWHLLVGYCGLRIP